jgi:DNA replication protein DnaC
MSSQISRSNALNTIPEKKLLEYISNINNSDLPIEKKQLKLTAINRYAECNLPVEYWPLTMEKSFHGDPNLLNKYNEYVSDLKDSYIKGNSICFAGPHGRGKTLATVCILKKCCQKGFSCLYTTLSDIVSVMTQGPLDEKYAAKRELVMVDFLAIEEFDNRYINSDKAADLYAQSLEGVFRTRSQNKLPTLMSTNSPNVVESFNGPLKIAIDSLMSGYIKIFPVFGEDYRKLNK